MLLKKYFAIGFIAACASGVVFGQQTNPKDPAAVAAENKQIEAENAAVKKAFDDAAAAIARNDRDAAIKTYDAAAKTYPTHPAIPTFLANKAALQTQMGIEAYNASIGKPGTGYDYAKQLFRNAAETSDKAVALAKSLKLEKGIEHIYATRARALRLVVTKVDPAELETAVKANSEYLAIETDRDNQMTARLQFAEMLVTAGDNARAKSEYEKAYLASPLNLGALFGYGVTLYFTGAESNDKAALQKSATLLRNFITRAAPNDPKRSEAQAVLDELKSSYNIVPK